SEEIAGLKSAVAALQQQGEAVRADAERQAAEAARALAALDARLRSEKDEVVQSQRTAHAQALSAQAAEHAAVLQRAADDRKTLMVASQQQEQALRQQHEERQAQAAAEAQKAA